MKKTLPYLLACSFMFLTTIGISAETYLTTITIRSGLNLSLNGNVVAPVDAAGNRVPVFLHNSTTYVPIRFISQFYGMKVDWDADTATVFLQKEDVPPFEGQKAPLISETKVGNIRVRAGIGLNLEGQDVEPKDVNGEPITCFLYGSTTFVPVRFISEYYHYQVSWDAETATVSINNPEDQDLGSSNAFSLFKLTPSGQKNVSFGEEIIGDIVTPVANLRNNGELSYDLIEKSKQLSFEMSLDKNEFVPSYKYQLEVYGDGILLASYSINKESLEQAISIDVDEINTLIFRFKTSAGVSYLKIYNAILSK